MLGMEDWSTPMRTHRVEELMADAEAIQFMISSGMSAIDDLMVLAGEDLNLGKATDLLRFCASLGQLSGILLWLTVNREEVLRKAMEVSHA